MEVVLRTEIPELGIFHRGKVRDMYDLGDRLLMIATDRISAFDSVLPNGIPWKGIILNKLSEYWFNYTRDVIENHVISSELPPELEKYQQILEGRAMLVRKTERIDVECVARGYLSGSAWKEYKERGSVCGIDLPQGLLESDKLPEIIFTPAIKASSGHDENISYGRLVEIVGEEMATLLRENTLRIYKKASKHAESKGLIIADTKFEFGLIDNELILIDELLTPDSSRFWSKEDYSPGKAQHSFDKQFVRDYLEEIGWNKEPPAPSLPQKVVEKTSERYLEAYRLITGEKLV